MKLGKFFNPTYSKLLYVLCGVLIGISISFDNWIQYVLFALAIGLAIFGDKVKKKEDEGI